MALGFYISLSGIVTFKNAQDLRDIVKDLPPLYTAFYENETLRTCQKCGALHPGKSPPPGWVKM